MRHFCVHFVFLLSFLLVLEEMSSRRRENVITVIFLTMTPRFNFDTMHNITEN